MLPEERAERAAGDVLHRHEGVAPILAHLEDGGHVRMADSSGGPRLAEEASPPLFIHRDRREELQGHDAPELGVLGKVDDPHPPATELCAEEEIADPRSHTVDVRDRGYDT